MMAIFHDMIEKTMEVFMDDFSVFGDSFSSCLSHLDTMIQRCEDTNLVLNWEKCHIMVKEDIVLDHKISKNRLEVDRAKVDVISKLPPPTTVKGVRSFLGHAGFYRRFIQDFSKIARPMTHLLEKDTPFVFSDECLASFKILKKRLTEAPILVSPDWDLPFELMCDASDYAVGAVLGQRKDKYFRPIHYANAKLRLIRWVLLLQEFTIEIHDKKGAENLAADHLSRLENPYQGDRVGMEINDNFPHESLSMISLNPDNKPPWFADIANYLVGNTGRKLWTFSKLAIMDPLGDTMARTTPQKKFLTSDFFGPPFIEMPRTLSHIVTRVSVRKRSHNGTKYPKILFRLSTSYHPQTSGQVEVSNRGLKRILERTIGEHRARWAYKLDDALWAFRTAYKPPIGCMPYKMVYGKACHLPIELKHKAYWALKWTNFDLKKRGSRKVQLNELNELRDQDYESSLIYKEKTKKIHDVKIKNHEFHVGDRVLLFNSRLKLFLGKLKSRSTGPFTVAQVFPYGTIELSQADGPNFKVNGHCVKHYFGGDIPLTDVPDLQTFAMEK
ncbi:reverse transcriptase domain-containing protein [Tanacetum coccineum]|uniref:Reverse transcriptase domain-containing protein n=1 Tax=Tanacetum coccineum TaxID=301880 RepID=A0ABQ5EDL7_9ASTR